MAGNVALVTRFCAQLLLKREAAVSRSNKTRNKKEQGQPPKGHGRFPPIKEAMATTTTKYVVVVVLARFSCGGSGVVSGSSYIFMTTPAAERKRSFSLKCRCLQRSPNWPSAFSHPGCTRALGIVEVHVDFSLSSKSVL